MIERNFIINTVPNSGSYLTINANQYDKGESWIFTVMADKEFVNLSGCSVVIQGIKPDNKGFSYAGSISNNQAVFTLTEQMTAIAGKFPCELRISKNSANIGTFNFVLDVEEAPFPSTSIISDSDISSFQQLADKTLTNAGIAQSSAESVSEAVDQINTVSVKASSKQVNSIQDLIDVAKEAGQYQWFFANTQSAGTGILNGGATGSGLVFGKWVDNHIIYIVYKNNNSPVVAVGGINPNTAEITQVSRINIGYALPLGAGSPDLDDMTMGGVYYYNANANATLPEGTNGHLMVITSNTTGTVTMQIFKRFGTPGTNDGNLYLRTKNSSGWGHWWKLKSVNADNSFYINNLSSDTDILGLEDGSYKVVVPQTVVDDGYLPTRYGLLTKYQSGVSTSTDQYYVGFIYHDTVKGIWYRMGRKNYNDTNGYWYSTWIPIAKTSEVITITRTENSYANAPNVNRLQIRKTGRNGYFCFNLLIDSSLPSNSTFVEIGSFDTTIEKEIVQTIPAQNGEGTILCQLTTAGKVNILNMCGNAVGGTSNSWYRAFIPVSFTY